MASGNEVYIPHIGWLTYPSDSETVESVAENLFEYQNQALLWLYLRPGDCYIDWSCGSGLFSVLAAKRMEPLGCVVARESGEHAVECLRHNLESHGITMADVVHGDPSRDQALETRCADQATCIRLGQGLCELTETVRYGLDVAAGRTSMVMFGSSSLSARQACPSFKDLTKAWAHEGFRFYRLDPHSLLLEPAESLEAGPLVNLFACADLEAAQERLGSAEPKWRRIAQEILRRGQAVSVVEDRLSDERLKLLRRVRVERDLAEQRLERLLGEWPIRLALRAHVVRPPAWAIRDRPAARDDDPVSRHLAAHGHAQQARAESERDAEEETPRPDLSAILCTYNPRKDIIEWALQSIAQQSLDPARFEVILVDNNSIEPITASSFEFAEHLPLRVVREKRQGLTYARLAGIRESRAKLLVFVDDDNHLDEDYFENCVAIAAQNPEIGLFGGIAEPKLEVPMAKWKERLLPYLGIRNHGDEPITSFETYWGEWEPIGAGMVARRDVAEAFIEFVENNPLAGGLGRTGQSLLACEDSLFARIANRLDYACSYQPSLRLQHYMKADRLKSGYLFKLLEGMGRSYVRLERILGHDLAPPGKWKMRANLLKRMILRCGRYGRSGFLQLGWDLGYMRELSDGKRD